jgi:ribonuclease Z
MISHFRQAYQWDVDFRITVGVPAAGAVIEASDVDPGVIYEKDGLKVTAFEVAHLPIDLTTREPLDFRGASYGYRIDYGEHSVVFSGDTRPSDNLVGHAQGADVLVYEVQVPSPGATEEAKLANVSLSVHSDPAQVGGIFARVNPRLAVYSHIIPPETTSDELEASTPYEGAMRVAHDLMMIVVGDEIEVLDRPLADTERFEDSRVLR